MYSGLKVKLSLLRVCVWEREQEEEFMSVHVCVCVRPCPDDSTWSNTSMCFCCSLSGLPVCNQVF